MRHALIGSLVLLTVVLSGCGYMPQFKASRTATVNQDHVAGTELVLDSKNGSLSIDVSPAHPDVSIDVTYRCAGENMDIATQRVNEATLEITSDTDRLLTIKPVFPGGRRNGDGADIAIRIPDVNSIHASSGNGRIVVSGGSGSLDAHTSNGRIEVANFDGPVDLTTSNGKIIVKHVTGSVTGRTSNGGVTLVLHDSAEGPVNLRTSNGSIDATLGVAFTGTMSMSTSNGSVSAHGGDGRITSMDMSKRSGTIVVGGSDEASRLSTSNGSITVRVES